MTSLFNSFFNNSVMPVLVIKVNDRLEVVYRNIKANILLCSGSETSNAMIDSSMSLVDIIHFTTLQEKNVFIERLQNSDIIEDYSCEINAPGGVTFASLSGNTIELEEADADERLYVLYIDEASEEDMDDLEEVLSLLMTSALLSDDIEESINKVLAVAGSRLNVNRAYIFEEISEEMTRNTYEWCDANTEPAIQMLQYLAKKDYNYDFIVSYGVFIANNVAEIEDATSREILEMQGIKSMFVVPFYDRDRPLGYVGFDDCEKTRVWTKKEISFLKDASAIITLLIKKRNAELYAQRVNRAFRIVSDCGSELIYVCDPVTYELLHVNRALADLRKFEPDELIGKTCWKTIYSDMEGPCPFCPIEKLKEKRAEGDDEPFEWEYDSEAEKVYLARSNLVSWIGGEDAFINTSVDITTRREYEKSLHAVASLDMLTGLYNRGWGADLIERICKGMSEKGSICFIDLDNMKATNDLHGHKIGDALLVSVAEVIKRNIGSNDIAVRWGGDEFLLYLACNKHDAEVKMKRMIKEADEINKENSEKGSFVNIAFSYGIEELEAGANITIEQAVTAADAKMYENKRERKGWNRRKTD